jgi:hypothetical protein
MLLADLSERRLTLYWLTNRGVSAPRLYWEYKGGFFNAKRVSIPVAGVRAAFRSVRQGGRAEEARVAEHGNNSAGRGRSKGAA